MTIVATSSALVVPSPSPAVDVYGLCSSIESQMVHIFDVGQLKDAAARLSAIDQYIARTSTEGRKQVQETMRRLEARCGWLLGPAAPNGKGSPASGSVATDPSPLTKDERHEFRQMAAHPDVVEQVIAESTDAEPPSRKKVLDAIAEQRTVGESSVPRTNGTGSTGQVTDPVAPDGSSKALDKSQAAVQERVAIARARAGEGMTSSQIAAELGMSMNTFSEFKRRRGITVPADAVVGRIRHVDRTRMINESMEMIVAIASSLAAIPDAQVTGIDQTRRDDWRSILAPALAELNRFKKKL